MAIGDQVGKAAVDELTLKTIPEALSGINAGLDKAEVTLADVVTVVGGEIDRLTSTVRDESQQWLAEFKRTNDLLERLLTKGVTLKVNE